MSAPTSGKDYHGCVNGELPQWIEELIAAFTEVDLELRDNEEFQDALRDAEKAIRRIWKTAGPPLIRRLPSLIIRSATH